MQRVAGVFSGRFNRVALAGGIALSAYVIANQPTIKAAEAGDKNIFVINGFYMAMREKYTTPGTSIHYYLIEWDPKDLSWEDFRTKVLGQTDPVTAENGSLRITIFSDWKPLGLTSEPNVGDNGMHASASPFEALAERLNWMGAALESDPFGKALLDSGIPKETIMTWTKDPQVAYAGKKASLFDLLEDLDYDECISKAQAIAGVTGKRPEGKMMAFVFIKPHAVTDATKELVAKKFAESNLKVYQQGELKAERIEKDKLIDNHYYAIANKASLMKPAELNPPAPKIAEFETKFGISWKQALDNGIVYNAVDGCTKLGIDGKQMDKTWATCKKEGNLIKFGGGFYAGKIPLPQQESSGWLAAVALAIAALFSR